MRAEAMTTIDHAIAVKQKVLLFFLGFCYVVLFYVVEGGGSMVWEEKNGEFMPPHKHTVKTVQTDVGDVFDCVHINKQPAIDHPLLKNHTVQMRPTSFPEGINEGGAPELMSSQIGLMKKGCPRKTIPVMRFRKNIFMRAESISKSYNTAMTNIHQLSDPSSGASYAAQLRLVRKKYYGTSADLVVYGLPEVSINQFSSTAIWIINDGDGFGSVDHANGLMAGWTVNPGLYGDNHTRLFTYWAVDGPQAAGCYNLLCPGFVQVNPEIPLGAIISPLSEYGGTQYRITVLIFKDPNTWNWWMVLGDDNKLVGYWPRSIFTTLRNQASMIYWGGLAYSPKNKPSPPMGSGHFPDERWYRACSCRRLQLVDENNKFTSPSEAAYYRDYPDFYDVGYYQVLGGEYNFLFGGPGGCILA